MVILKEEEKEEEKEDEGEFITARRWGRRRGASRRRGQAGPDLRLRNVAKGNKGLLVLFIYTRIGQVEEKRCILNCYSPLEEVLGRRRRSKAVLANWILKKGLC